MKKPSLFDYATSELSQDAILCWLLEWAKHDEDGCEKYQELATELIKFLYCLANPTKSVNNVKLIDPEIDPPTKHYIKKQYLHIDVYFVAEIDGKRVSFIIEDKTFTSHHDNQLEKYKDKIKKDRINENEIVPIYFKTGHLYEWDEDVEKYGYHILDLKKWYGFLSKYEGIKNDILVDYLSYIKGMLTGRDKEIEKLSNGEPDFTLACVQYDFLKTLKENCGECIGKIKTKDDPYNLYNGTSYGRPWTQYQFVKYENVYDGKPELVFYRVDSRNAGHYFSIRQYTGAKVRNKKELSDKKFERLGVYKELFEDACISAGSEFSFSAPVQDKTGYKESEIAVLFFNNDTNSAKELWSKWPELHNRFVEKIRVCQDLYKVACSVPRY